MPKTGDAVQGHNPADTAKKRHGSRSSSKEPEKERVSDSDQPMEKILEGMENSQLATPSKDTNGS
eukprot:754077-Rhodomonas_salina.1